MGYFDELKKGQADSESVAGESFAYNGTAGFKGYVGDDDPTELFATTGVKTQQSLVIDANALQFSRKGIVPNNQKKTLVYDGKTFVVREVFKINQGATWRFKIYLP